jgi:hypothetical protein
MSLISVYKFLLKYESPRFFNYTPGIIRHGNILQRKMTTNVQKHKGTKTLYKLFRVPKHDCVQLYKVYCAILIGSPPLILYNFFKLPTCH